MTAGFKLSIAFVLVWIAAACSSVEAFGHLVMLNGALQVGLFSLVACVPYLRTGRMSYVDIAWPFGVALIGAVLLLAGDGPLVRRAIVSGVYLFVGLRMGVGALVMAKRTGVIFATEFPRYEYRRMRMEQAGVKHLKLHTLAEIMAQGLANASVLALPGLLIATHRTESISVWEIAGACVWGVGYVLESVADAQKMVFTARYRGAVCDVGLWRYSRHPNYFAEWLVWTGLVVVAVPSWLARQAAEPWPIWISIGVGSLGASVTMYITLVYLTGAIPAEYYSATKREGYREYQRRTNMFFPWWPRTDSNHAAASLRASLRGLCRRESDQLPP